MIARWTIVGFVLWLAVTAAFYFGRNAISVAPGGVTLLFLTVPIALFVLTYMFLKILKVEPNDRAEAACVFALPGLLIGIYMINSFRNIFTDPRMLPEEFASLMFASYAAICAAGLISSRLAQHDKSV